jgi:hypothetical protein
MCTLTASNYQGSSSSTVNISVSGNNYCNGYNCGISHPSVYAGSRKTVQSGQSVYLDATVSNQGGYPLTYSWSCTGGSLSNYNVLNPTYYAPNTSYNATYMCTLTASNYQGSSSSGVSISVLGNGYNYYNYNDYNYNYNYNNGYKYNYNNGYNYNYDDCSMYGYGCTY